MFERRRSVGVALAASLCAFVFGAPVAQATHVGCGDVITTDTRLDSDILDCSGDGVVIGAPGITLDLEGHTIDGVTGNFFASGVDNVAGHDDVTVEDGSVQDFGEGVLGVGADRLVVRNLSILALRSGNSGVLFADGSDGGLVERNYIEGRPAGGAGVHLSDSDDNVVRRNTIVDEGWGIAVGGNADRNLVERNDVTASRFTGILLLQLTTDDVFRRNDASGNDQDGFSVSHNTSGTLLERNTAHSNGDDGIQVGSQVGTPLATILAHNRANGNADLGIEAVTGVIDGGHNRASGNGNAAQCTGVAC